MLPEHRTPTHPGEILEEEFLRPLGISPLDLSRHVGLSPEHVRGILREEVDVTPAVAWLLGGAFGTTPLFWSNLQTGHDLARCRPDRDVPRIAPGGGGT